MKSCFILAGILLAVLGNARADTFRWVDKSGNVHYGDVPTEEAAQVEQKKFGATADAADADLPYATRLARQNFPVTLYVSTNCGNPCQMARDFLNKRAVPFVEQSPSTQQDIDAFKLVSGSDTVPTLGVGKTWLKGFEAGQWNGELDFAGYPRTAPYRPQITPAPALSKPALKQ